MTTSERFDNFVKKANHIHHEKYDYSHVEYVNSHTKIKILCSSHGIFQQCPGDHLKGQGCYYCGIHNKRETLEKFIAKARSVHSNKYNYSFVKLTGNTIPVIIVCPTHGQFNQTPMSHKNGSGCLECATIIRNEKVKNRKPYKTTEQFIQQAIKRHGTKYTYLNTKYKKDTGILIITCPVHGDFNQTAGSHISGRGCPNCATQSRLTASLQRCLTTKIFTDTAISIHGNAYNYTHVDYKNSKTKVDIICPKHGLFKQTPSNHISNKQGCPRCKSKLCSRIQIEWLQTIAKENNLIIQHAYNGGEFTIPKTRITVDGYCKENNTVYEFYGDYWHGNPKKYKPDYINTRANKKTMGYLYEYTLKRERKIRAAGYNLITIWESDYKLKNVPTL